MLSYLLVGLWGVFGQTPLFLFQGFYCSWGARDFFFFSFLFSLVCGGLGVLDHGAGLMVCFSFPFLIHYISRLDIPKFVHFVFDGPLHCHKVGKRSRLHDYMQVHGCNYGITPHSTIGRRHSSPKHVTSLPTGCYNI